MSLEEKRFCDMCGMKTVHEVVDTEKALYNPRGRASYKCKKCGRVTSKRRLRPSAEASY